MASAGIIDEAGSPSHIDNPRSLFVYVMDRVYQVAPPEMQTMVRDLLAMTGVEVVHEIDYAALFALWPTPIDDFADAVVAVVCKQYKNALVATFDKKLISALKKMGVSPQRFI